MEKEKYGAWPIKGQENFGAPKKLYTKRQEKILRQDAVKVFAELPGEIAEEKRRYAKASDTVKARKDEHRKNWEEAIRAARGGSLPHPFIVNRSRKTQKR